jgi:hypothetical protein
VVPIRTSKYVKPLIVMCMLIVSLFASASAFANTGTTGETTWLNAAGDPTTTNQFSSDSALGCPTTINIWQTDTPGFDGPTYFHVNAIDPTADPFVHASGPYTATVGSSTPTKIGSIDTATLIQSAKDTGQPLDSNGQGYHYRLAFDYFMTSTVDFWVNCADTTPPPDPSPTPAPQPTPDPTPVSTPPSDTTTVTVTSPPSDPKTTTTTTGSDTTTTGTPNTCPRLKPHQINKLIKANYNKKVKKGRVRVSVKVAKSVGVNRIVIKVINGKHVKTFGTSDERKLSLTLNTRSKSIFGKRSWKRAYIKVTFYRGCGDNFVWNLR